MMMKTHVRMTFTYKGIVKVWPLHFFEVMFYLFIAHSFLFEIVVYTQCERTLQANNFLFEVVIVLYAHLSEPSFPQARIRDISNRPFFFTNIAGGR